MSNVTAVRIDINCPIDPKSGKILEDWKIKEHAKAIKEYEDSPVVVMSHQSRPGEDDFTSLKEHARIFRKYNDQVQFIDDVMGPSARSKINNLNPGEILLLDNVRFLSEELLKGPREVLAKTHFVRQLSPLFSRFIHDAFAAAHRRQASLVGFCEVLPSYAGPIMKKELTVLNKVVSDPKAPVVFHIGGSKEETKLKLIKNILSNEKADKVLVSGLLGNCFLRARGIRLGDASEKRLKNKYLLELAQNILKRHSKSLELPTDVAVRINGERSEIGIDSLPSKYEILDIGSETIDRYSSIIKNAGTILVNGPSGYFEEKAFALGTEQLMTGVAKSRAFSVIGGGHLTVVAINMGYFEQIDHVSTGGGATMAFLAGDKLPVLEALRHAYKRDGREFPF